MKRMVITLTVTDDTDTTDLADGVNGSIGTDATAWEWADFWLDVNAELVGPNGDGTAEGHLLRAIEHYVPLRCPECDTYSGQFRRDGAGEIVHSTCGRSGSPASFTRGTPEYDSAAEGGE